MTIMPEELRIDNAIEEKFRHFMKRFGINGMLRKAGAAKSKGVCAYLIFTFLIGLVFTRRNLYKTMAFSRDAPSFSKNAAYRYLSNPHVNWEAFICGLSDAVIPEIDKLTSENKYYKGFTLLNLGWSDGQTYVPADYRVLASGSDGNLLEGSHAKEDRRTIATKRRASARMEKPKLALQMLENAKGTPRQAKHVLFDSWFSSPSFLLSVKSLGYDSVARLKNHENFRYAYAGGFFSISKIHSMNRKRRGRSRYLLSVDVGIRHADFEETVPAKIVFVRERNIRKKWIALISTDNSLTEDEIIEYYGKRWDIEPFHKTIKNVLMLEKEFQLRSFDAISAHTAIVLTRYIFLALENRKNKDERTLGELFFYICEELSDITFQHAFDLLMSLLQKFMHDNFVINNEDCALLVKQFIDDLPECFKVRLVA